MAETTAPVPAPTPPPEGRIVHLDLTPEGFEGQWIDLHNPKYMTQTRFDELVRKMRSSDQQELEAGVRAIVSAWHLVNEDTGADMNDPTSDQLGALTFGHTRILTDAWWDRVNAQLPKALRQR